MSENEKFSLRLHNLAKKLYFYYNFKRMVFDFEVFLGENESSN